jgi:hypothetical protein
MSGVKDIAKRVAAVAAERKVRFPKIWDESQILQACGTTLVSNHGSFAPDICHVANIAVS